MNKPKRLIQVDPPSKRIAASERAEKPIQSCRTAEVTTFLRNAVQELRAIMRDEFLMSETSLEVQDAMESAAENIDEALRRLKSEAPEKAPSPPLPGRPTCQ